MLQAILTKSDNPNKKYTVHIEYYTIHKDIEKRFNIKIHYQLDSYNLPLCPSVYIFV